MRLTKTTRRIFIDRVMADVPSVDYEQLIEDAVRQEYVDKLPPAVRRIWDDSELRSYVAVHDVRRPQTYGYVKVPTNSSGNTYISSPAVARLCELRMQQKEKRQELSNMLHAVAWAHNTDVKLREALPEFAKYVPGDTPVDRTVPVLTGVVGAFRDAGWSADKK